MRGEHWGILVMETKQASMITYIFFFNSEAIFESKRKMKQKLSTLSNCGS